MLKTPVLHPGILAVLGRAGHSSKILIADGNYPFATRKNPAAEIIHLNFTPGVLSATEVLKGLLGVINVEKVEVMEPMRSGPYAMAGDPPIFGEFAAIVKQAGFSQLELTKTERFAFYDAAESKDVAMVIATGEQRIYGNCLLTIGVVMP